MRWILLAAAAFAFLKSDLEVDVALPTLLRTPETLFGIAKVLDEVTRNL